MSPLLRGTIFLSVSDVEVGLREQMAGGREFLRLQTAAVTHLKADSPFVMWRAYSLWLT
jgi:hypothetical protein